MSRYLTPSKVGLLALISLYTESVIPSVATIPVLSFLVSQILPIKSTIPRSDVSLHSLDTTITLNDIQKATINHSSGIPGRTVWDLLLTKLWKIYSLDALHDFFDTLSRVLQKTREQLQNEPEYGLETGFIFDHMLLSRTSPLGAFVRRARLEFTRLQFHDALTLWKSFVVYRAPTLSQWKKRNPTAGNTSFDINLQQEHLGIADRLTEAVYGELGTEASQEVGISTEDVEKLLEYQVDQLQSMQKG